MKRFLMQLTVMVASLLVSASLWAATVYLRNGDEIECDSYRQEGDRVFVKINPETEVDFTVDEIDPARTPLEKPAVKKEMPKAKEGRVADAEQENSNAAGAIEPQSVDTTPWFAGETPPGYRPGTPGLRNELAKVYEKFNRAALSGNFKETTRYMPKEVARRSLDSLAKIKDKKELLLRKKNMQNMAVKNFTVDKCAVSPDGKIAALAGRGITSRGGKYQEAKGTVRFLKENDGWKVSLQVW